VLAAVKGARPRFARAAASPPLTAAARRGDVALRARGSGMGAPGNGMLSAEPELLPGAPAGGAPSPRPPVHITAARSGRQDRRRGKPRRRRAGARAALTAASTAVASTGRGRPTTQAGSGSRADVLRCSPGSLLFVATGSGWARLDRNQVKSVSSALISDFGRSASMAEIKDH
jgi:hypothetical protein